jgi:voltage-gated potassium channel
VRVPPGSYRHLAYALLALVALQTVGTLGFMAIMDEGFVDALYRTVIYFSTVGLDTLPETAGAKLFSIAVVVAGVATFLYILGLVVQLNVIGAVTGAWTERRVRRAVDELSGHIIICGYGRVGRRVAREFRDANETCVVLDINPEAVAVARRDGLGCIEGTGTNDEDLEAAGLSRARGLVVSSDSDVDNLYIALSARSLRPDLLIVARASTEDAATKLIRAGADRVVLPYAAAGQEMAKLVLKPQVAAFLDIVTSFGGPDLRLEEIEVTEACRGAGRSIRDLRIRHETGALVVAVRHPDGTFETTPSPDLVLAAADVLIAVGTDVELRRLEDLFAPSEALAG